MTLNQDSLLVRWTYILSDHRVPKQTSLCAFFWRGFVLMPLLAFCVLFVFGTILGTLWKFPMEFFGAFLIIAAIVGGCLLCSWFHGQSLPDTVTKSVFFQGLKATKNKICPIIYIK